jgi:hypothetical protein
MIHVFTREELQAEIDQLSKDRYAEQCKASRRLDLLRKALPALERDRATIDSRILYGAVAHEINAANREPPK